MRRALSSILAISVVVACSPFGTSASERDPATGVAEGGAPASDAGAEEAAAAVTFSTDGGPVLVHSDDADAGCSVDTREAAVLDVHNRSEAGVRVRWVRFDCMEADYGHLDPGEMTRIPTYAQHRWRLRRAGDGGVIVDFTLGGRGHYIATAH